MSFQLWIVGLANSLNLRTSSISGIPHWTKHRHTDSSKRPTITVIEAVVNAYFSALPISKEEKERTKTTILDTIEEENIDITRNNNNSPKKNLVLEIREKPLYYCYIIALRRCPLHANNTVLGLVYFKILDCQSPLYWKFPRLRNRNPHA